MVEVCVKCYGEKVWMCGDTNESLAWNDTTTEKLSKLTGLNFMHSFQ